MAPASAGVSERPGRPLARIDTNVVHFGRFLRQAGLGQEQCKPLVQRFADHAARSLHAELRFAPAFLPRLVRQNEKVDPRDPQAEQDHRARQEDPQLGAIVKEAAVMQALDQVGSPVGGLQDFASLRIDLDLVAVDRLEFQHAFPGSDVETVDILPAVNFGFGNGFGCLEDLVKTQRQLFAAPVDGRWLNPRHLLLQEEEDPGHDHQQHRNSDDWK